VESLARSVSGPLDLLDHGRQLMDTAGSAPSGRAARNLVPGAGQPLTQTLLAMGADVVLADHDAPGPATLQVLDGEGVLTLDGDDCVVAAGQWVRIPEGPHGLRAVTDLVCLLTVAARHANSSDEGATT